MSTRSDILAKMKDGMCATGLTFLGDLTDECAEHPELRAVHNTMGKVALGLHLRDCRPCSIALTNGGLALALQGEA